MSGIILDLCGGTGSWSKPYRDAGYDVRLITLPEYDVRHYEPPGNVYGILAAPPCTEFSVLNCVAAPRERNEEEGMVVVNACLKIIEQCKPKFYAWVELRGWDGNDYLHTAHPSRYAPEAYAPVGGQAWPGVDG